MPQTISLSISLISPPFFSPINLLTSLYQVTKSETSSCNIFEICLLQILDVQICKKAITQKLQRAITKKVK